MALLSIGPATPAGTGGTVIIKDRHAVYMREKWSDNWEHVPYLAARTAVEAAFPGPSSATLVFVHGETKYEDDDAYTDLRARAKHDHYLFIMVMPEDKSPFALWVGIVPVHQFNVFASKITDPAAPQTVAGKGEEILQAAGLEYLLARRRVNRAWVKEPDAGVPRSIDWQPPFNVRNPIGPGPTGNRAFGVNTDDDYGASEPHGRPIYSFGSDLTAGGDGYWWSAVNIIDYLLFWSNKEVGENNPEDPEETPLPDEPHFTLFGSQPVLYYLDAVYDVLPQDGESVLSLMKRLLDRRRGIGADLSTSLNHDTTSEQFGFPGKGSVGWGVYSMSDVTSRVGGYAFPANRNRAVIELDTGIVIKDAVVTVSSLNVYDKIVVWGARLVSCFSLPVAPGMLQGAWPAADEADYRDLETITTASGINRTADDQRTDDRWARVYRQFRFDDDFNWVNESGEKLNPIFAGDGSLLLGTNANVWTGKHRLLPWTPIRDPADSADATTEPKRLLPAVFLELLDDEGAGTGVWARADNLPADLLAGPDGPKNATIKMHEREGLFEVMFTPAHRLGRNHFSDDPAVDETNVRPVFDFEKMIATIAVEADSRPSVEVATNVPGAVKSRTLELEVPDAQVWIAAQSTVIGIYGSGGLRYHLGSRVLRDDTDRLQSVAALAKSVYGKRRASIRLKRKGLLLGERIGTMIDSVLFRQQQQEVNAVVSRRIWDFQNGTTTIETEYVNLDLLRVR